MKKINYGIAISILALSSVSYAQEIIPVDNGDSIEDNIAIEEQSNGLKTTRSLSEDRTLNDLILTSGGQLSQQVIEEISNLQEERSLLEARISTAESRQRYIEIERNIREMGGGIEMELPKMLGSHGVNGVLRAVIEYGEGTYEVSRGSFIDSSWVVRNITKDKVELLNIDDERTMHIGISSPSIIR
jgi:hypothetical protein